MVAFGVNFAVGVHPEGLVGGDFVAFYVIYVNLFLLNVVTFHAAWKSEDNTEGADIADGADIKKSVVGNRIGSELISAALIAGVHAYHKSALLNLHNLSVFKSKLRIA